MQEAAHETLSLACLDMGERRRHACEQERRGTKRCTYQARWMMPGTRRPFVHPVPPKSMRVRCIVQKAPSDPTAYPGRTWSGLGHLISSVLKERSKSRIKITKKSWPISTPMLNRRSAIGISALGPPNHGAVRDHAEKTWLS